MQTTTNWMELIRQLGTDFAGRTAEHDECDSFVAENYAALKANGAFAAGVPAELGGGNASHAELCAMVRELAHYCSSTALAFAMHTHLVATLAYLWRAGNKGPEPMLRRGYAGSPPSGDDPSREGPADSLRLTSALQ